MAGITFLNEKKNLTYGTGKLGWIFYVKAIFQFFMHLHLLILFVMGQQFCTVTKRDRESLPFV